MAVEIVFVVFLINSDMFLNALVINPKKHVWNCMRNKIKKQAIEWYSNIENHDETSIDTFIDLVMDKTTEVLLEEIKKEFKNEFLSGTLKHDFIISPDYYLELKLKEILQNLSLSDELKECEG